MKITIALITLLSFTSAFSYATEDHGTLPPVNVRRRDIKATVSTTIEQAQTVQKFLDEATKGLNMSIPQGAQMLELVWPDDQSEPMPDLPYTATTDEFNTLIAQLGSFRLELSRATEAALELSESVAILTQTGYAMPTSADNLKAAVTTIQTRLEGLDISRRTTNPNESIESLRATKQEAENIVFSLEMGILKNATKALSEGNFAFPKGARTKGTDFDACETKR